MLSKLMNRYIFNSKIIKYNSYISLSFILLNINFINKNNIKTFCSSSDNNSNNKKIYNNNRNEILESFIFPNSIDSFNGINIDLSKLNIIDDDNNKKVLNDIKLFRNCLNFNLIKWKENKYRAIWLKVPIEYSYLIYEILQEGFVFHSAENDYIILVNWLPKLNIEKYNNNTTTTTNNNNNNNINYLDSTTISKIKKSVEYIKSTAVPANASHQVGVGCVVLNHDNTKILVVQERRGPLRGKNVYKIPTGLIGAGEDISTGSIREVLEETNITTEFKGIVAIRHTHNVFYDKSDLFYICVLEPKNYDIKIQHDELDACEWIDLDLYLNQSRYITSPLYTMINETIKYVANNKNTIPYFMESKLEFGPNNRNKFNSCSLYHSTIITKK